MSETCTQPVAMSLARCTKAPETGMKVGLLREALGIYAPGGTAIVCVPTNEFATYPIRVVYEQEGANHPRTAVIQTGQEHPRFRALMCQSDLLRVCRLAQQHFAGGDQDAGSVNKLVLELVKVIAVAEKAGV